MSPALARRLQWPQARSSRAAGQAHSIALNDDDLCVIFSGKPTNWNQVTNRDLDIGNTRVCTGTVTGR